MSSPTKASGAPRRIGRPEAKRKKAEAANDALKGYAESVEMRGGIVGSGLGGAIFEGGENILNQRREGEQND